MRQIDKIKLYCSSADRKTGTTGDFKIVAQFPLQFKKNLFYKIYPLQVVLRNDFPWTTAADTFTMQLGAFSAFTVTLPPGNPTIDTIAAFLSTGQLPGQSALTPLNVSFDTTTGKLAFTTGLATSCTLTFPAGTPAAAKLGFVAGNTYVSSFSGLSQVLYSATVCVVNPTSVVDMHTNIPRKNYRIKNGKFSSTTLTARIPVTVPFQATQVYSDLNGANAMYEAYRDHLDTIDVKLKDENEAVVNPVSEWNFTICIETWVDDTDTQTTHLSEVADATRDLNFQSKLKLVKQHLDESQTPNKFKPNTNRAGQADDG